VPIFANNLLINQNELRFAVIQNLAAAPASPKPGQMYYDTVNLATYMYSTVAGWVATDASKLVGTIPNVALVTNPLARANHTGTQLAATISNFAAAAEALTLDTFAAPVSPVLFNGQRIENIATPVAGTDAANMSYVLAQATAAAQSAAAGIVSKQACAVVSVANQATLSGLLTIDGVTLVAGQRVLLTAQTTASQNGPYIAAAGAWARSTNDSNGELDLGATWFVEQGTTYSASTWRLGSPTSGTITPGTTAVTITQLTAANTYTSTNGILLTGNAFTGVVAPSGGLVVTAAGFAVDTTITARKYSTNIGDGTSTTFTITHNLGTIDVVAAIRDSSGNLVITDWQAASTTTIVVTFSVAPAANAYRVTVVG
jgi:hypothetical protein